MKSQTKHCNLCGEWKPETDFYKNSEGYLQSKCKTCHKEFYRGKYRTKEKLMSKYPQARCYECEKIYKLNFYPLQLRNKMKEVLLCDDCKLNGTE